MNKEKVEFDHFKDIEELIQHLEMWYAEDDYYAYDRFFGLRDARIMGMYIYQLLQENQQLNQLLKDKGFIIDKLMEENRQLKESRDKALKKIDNMFNLGNEYTIIDDLLELDKILKGSDNNV